MYFMLCHEIFMKKKQFVIEWNYIVYICTVSGNLRNAVEAVDVLICDRK